MSARSIEDLIHTAAFEAERLVRVEAVDARQELRLRVWPFLLDLCEMLVQTEPEPDTAAQVEPIARAVGVMAALVDALGKPVTDADKAVLAAQAEAAVAGLASLVTPEDLAAFLASQPAPEASQPEAPQATLEVLGE